MGKNRSKKRRRLQQQADNNSGSVVGEAYSSSNYSPISPEEVLIASETLVALSQHAATTQQDLAALLSTRDLKELRTALYPFCVAFSSRLEPVDYPNRVTEALTAKKWGDALQGLRACLELEVAETHAVKRGTLQRWVRFCDDCPHPNLKQKLLLAILACSPEEQSSAEMPTDATTMNALDPRQILQHPGTTLLSHLTEGIQEPENGESTEEMNVLRTTTWSCENQVNCELKIPAADSYSIEQDTKGLDHVRIETVHHVCAANRKPVNYYDLKIFATPPNAVGIEFNGQSRARRHDITGIPGAYMITDALSRAECIRIVALAERMGFVPDHPVESGAPTGIDTCEWLADSTILDPIHARVMGCLNHTVHSETVAGINARWRLFRYGRNSVYRPHIDGSWPGSGRSDAGSYISDAFGDRRSRFTFLLYLNDDFEDGGTTFYFPSKSGGESGFETVVVRPRMGAALCFPQGNTATLLHEGSRVTGGTSPKYVI